MLMIKMSIFIHCVYFDVFISLHLIVRYGVLRIDVNVTGLLIHNLLISSSITTTTKS